MRGRLAGSINPLSLAYAMQGLLFSAFLLCEQLAVCARWKALSRLILPLNSCTQCYNRSMADC